MTTESPGQLSRAKLYVLSFAGAVITANAYYIHPIIARVADDFQVSDAMIGAVPALNQIALALGILFLLPLGDRFSNRKLTSIFVAGQFCGILAMAFVTDFRWFVVGSSLLGFFTIAPYLLPAYVSKRVPPSELGPVTSILTAGIIGGIIGGILLARAEDRKHNVPFRQIVKIRMALFQTFGWRAGSGWVVVQADTYRLTSCFLSR